MFKERDSVLKSSALHKVPASKYSVNGSIVVQEDGNPVKLLVSSRKSTDFSFNRRLKTQTKRVLIIRDASPQAGSFGNFIKPHSLKISLGLHKHKNKAIIHFRV